MQFQNGDIFHIYNRGNNKQQIFFSEDNYQFFVAKIKHYVCPVSDVLAYCLMPNHFHLLLRTNDLSGRLKKIGTVSSTELTNSFRVLQSTYANAINKQNGSIGSLFQQKTQFKLLSSSTNLKHDDLQCCFHYIHQNPLRARLVKKMEEWKFSSFNEYLTGVEDGICNNIISKEIIGLPAHLFYEASYSTLNEDMLKDIF